MTPALLTQVKSSLDNEITDFPSIGRFNQASFFASRRKTYARAGFNGVFATGIIY